MPRLITLSRAARLVGVKRGVLQSRIRQGELRTFEGELLLSDLLHAYPQTKIEDTTMLERVEHIMEQAVNKIIRPEFPFDSTCPSVSVSDYRHPAFKPHIFKSKSF